MTALCIFTESRPRRKPLQNSIETRDPRNGNRDASFREETYRVATTLTPSVTQKFIKLGYETKRSSQKWKVAELTYKSNASFFCKLVEGRDRR